MVARSLLRGLLRGAGWRLDQSAEDVYSEPAVFLVQHHNMSGPIHSLGLLPDSVHVWALSSLFSCGDCFEQYYGYTFTKRYGWPRLLALPAAAAGACVVPRLMRATGAVPVYRGKREILETMEESVRLLHDGESLLICPDKDYSSQKDEIGEIYTGFLHLEKLYWRDTGRHLAFIPLCVDRQKKRITAAEPLFFAGTGRFKEEQRQMEERLMVSFRRLECRRQMQGLPEKLPTGNLPDRR